MKKIIVAILMLLLTSALLLTACAPKDNAPAAGTDAPEGTSALNTAEATGEPEITSAPTAGPTEEPTEKPTDAPTEPPTPSPLPTAADIEKGKNVALDADVEVSSSTGDVHVQWGWSREYINDGIYWSAEDNSYGWTTAVGVNTEDPDQDEWVLFTLAKYTNVDKVIVYPTVAASCFPVEFIIEVSTDGKEFTTVARNENTKAAESDASPVELTFDAVTAKYVRFTATKLNPVLSGNDGYLCQLGEIEIFAA